MDNSEASKKWRQNNGWLVKDHKAFTFDDVLLMPDYSDVLPHEADVSTYLTEEIKLGIPIVSADMDTVTEAKLGICIALEGGIGFIHRNMSISDQANEVAKVKRSQSGMIPDPETLDPNQTVGEAKEIMKSKNISGLPIVKKGHLVGILTGRDIRLASDNLAPVKNAMTPKEKLITVNEGTTPDEAEIQFEKHLVEKLPVVDPNFKLVGLFTFKDVEKSREFPLASKDCKGRLRVGASIGVKPGERLERAQAAIDAGADVLCVGTAHGHSKNVIDTVAEIRSNFRDAQIVAGNAATKEGAAALTKAGANAVKVGVGPGSICTTRIVAGVGVPQISAIAACRNEGIIIADGGIRFSGDITKAIAAGAHTVMIGSLFAGTEESPGEAVFYQGRKYKVYRGMGSLEAMKKGSEDRYGYTDKGNGKIVPEGIVGRVPYRDSLSFNLLQLVGGLKSGMGYCGCQSVEELRNNAVFCQITAAGQIESHVHDVYITKEAPNYQRD